MKVVFLDFDGVLNSRKYDNERDLTKNTNIDESRLPLLKQIIDETDAKIVLSTSWRKHWEKNSCDCDETGTWINELFFKYGMKIYDKTPTFDYTNARSKEIKSWLDNCSQKVKSFVILDDIFFGWDDLFDNLVQTNPYIGRGLEVVHVKKAIEILNK